MRRNKLHIPHPVRRLRRTGVVRSVVPPFPTRIASLDSRGSPVPFANPLKTTKKGAAAPFLGFSPGLGLCGICFQIVQTRDGCVFDRPAWQSKYSAIVSNVPCVEVRLCAICSAALAGRTAFRLPYVKYSTGADRTTCMAYRAIGKPDSTACVTTKRRTERRAFQARQRYLASSGLFFHIFSAKTEKIWPAERRMRLRKLHRASGAFELHLRRHPTPSGAKKLPFPGLLLRAKLSTCGCGLFTNFLFTTAQQMFHKTACGQI